MIVEDETGKVNMFERRMVEDKTGKVNIDDVKPEVMESMLFFIYHDEIEVNLNYYFHLHVCPSFCPALVTLQRFILLIAPEAPTALVPGAPEPRIYPRRE